MTQEGETKPPVEVSRREFGQRAALAIAAVGLLPATVAVPSAIAGCACTASPEQTSKAASLSTAARAEIESKVQHVIQKYGDRFTDDQKRRLRPIIEYHVRMLESVRRFRLENGDSPASVLKLMAGGSAQPPSTAGHAGIGDIEHGF